MKTYQSINLLFYTVQIVQIEEIEGVRMSNLINVVKNIYYSDHNIENALKIISTK